MEIANIVLNLVFGFGTLVLSALAVSILSMVHGTTEIKEYYVIKENTQPKAQVAKVRFVRPIVQASRDLKAMDIATIKAKPEVFDTLDFWPEVDAEDMIITSTSWTDNKVEIATIPTETISWTVALPKVYTKNEMKEKEKVIKGWWDLVYPTNSYESELAHEFRKYAEAHAK